MCAEGTAIYDVVSYYIPDSEVPPTFRISEEKENEARRLMAELLDLADEEGDLPPDKQAMLSTLSWIFDDLDKPDIPHG